MPLLPLLLFTACAVDPPSADPCAGEAAWVENGGELSLALEGCGALALDAEGARILGQADDLSVRWESSGATLTPVVEAGSEGGVVEGLVVEGSLELAGDEPLRWWRQGYQSWSFSGVVEPESVEFDDDGVPQLGGDEDSLSFAGDTPFSSWWIGLLGRPDGASALVGALDSQVFRFALAVSTDQDGVTPTWLVWGTRGASVALEPGETRSLDPIRAGFSGDAFSLHRDYARAVADRIPPRPLPDLPPVGWSSWNIHYEDVTEDKVLANLEAARDLAARDDLAALTLIQVDDGWQELWGAWSAGEDFPSGMPALAREIASAGFTPGLWMAPFYVHRDTDTYADHDDWWVLDESGEELSFSNLGTGDYAVLDVTHPDAAHWLESTVAQHVDEGWTYLKLDFLYAGAQEGQRYEPVTGMEAFHRGMEILREAAGDAWILACGAPFLPSVGYAESYRTGSDIAMTHDPDPRLAYLRWQVRATAARSWTQGIWWWVDPDALLVREPFDLVEARGAVVGNAVSGGAWILGEDLSSLDEDRLALALHPSAAALRGTVGEPLEPLRFVSGFDIGPAVEMVTPDDVVPWSWAVGDTDHAVLDLAEEALSVPCPTRSTGLFDDEPCLPGQPFPLTSGEGEILLDGEE